MCTHPHLHLYAISYLLLLSIALGCSSGDDGAKEPDPRAYARYKKAIELRDAGDLQASLKENDRAIDLNPELADAHEVRGHVLHDLGRYREAIDAFTQYLRLTDWDNADVYRCRAEAYIALGDFKCGAFRDLSSAIEYDPTNPDRYLERAKLFDRLGMPDNAAADYAAAIALDDTKAQYYVERGLSYIAFGNVGGALADFDKASALDPNCATAYLGRGLCYRARKDDEAALQAFLKASEIDPRHVRAHLERGRTLARLGQYDEAIKAFEQGIEIQADDPELHIQRALAHLALGNHRVANSEFTKACRLLGWRFVPEERPSKTADGE